MRTLPRSDDLNRLMPVELVAEHTWAVECPWCGEGVQHDRQWRCHRWRFEHVCTAEPTDETPTRDQVG